MKKTGSSKYDMNLITDLNKKETILDLTFVVSDKFTNHLWGLKKQSKQLIITKLKKKKTLFVPLVKPLKSTDIYGGTL